MKYVVIGASAAGLAAAKILREKDPEGIILVLTSDHQVHSRVMLHHYLSKIKTPEQLNFVAEDFFSSKKIYIMYDRTVTQVRPEAQEVVLADGSAIEYDRLLLATGASYVVPPIPNLREGTNYYGFRDLSDAQKLNQVIAPGKHCVVIGSGLVGLDCTFGLVERGVHCDVVEMADRISPLQLDHTAAATYQKKFEEKGADFYLSDGVTGVTLGEGNAIVSVELKSGKSLPCDFVAVTAGVRPNVGFLEGSGILVERGIQVDPALRTSAPHIWAAGDVTGIAGIWMEAVKQGELAAKSMCGEEVNYEDRFALKNTMNFFGLNTLSLGKDEEVPGDEVIVRESREQYEKYRLREGVLVYALIQGDISNRGILEQLIKRKISIKGKPPVWKLSYADFFDYDAKNGKYNW